MLSMYRNSEGKTVVDIKDCEAMREVKLLKMCSLGLTDFDVQLFSQLTNLEEMDISDNQLDTIPQCIQLPKLKRLDCSNNKFADLQFVRHFPSLENINSEGNQVAFADLCIAAYLCPRLKRMNDQTIDIQTLNRKIENRVKPLILRVWNKHMKSLYRPAMNESEFQTIANKFRVLLKHVDLPTTKPISKFQDFRAALLVEEFLSMVRNTPPEEDIEFGGSVESVKRNYTKKKKDAEGETACDPQVETVTTEVSITEESQTDAAVVVAVADEEGNGVLTIDDVTTILTSDQFNEASAVTIFVENVCAVAGLEETKETDAEPTLDAETREVDVEKNEKDFIDVETERVKALDQAKSDCVVERHSAASLGDCVQSDIRCEEKAKGKSDGLALPLDESANGDERKVVRYWMYEGPKPKSLPSNPGTGTVLTSRSLGKKEEDQSVNGTQNSDTVGTRRTAGSRVRGRPISKYRDDARAKLISKMKINGTIPTVPKFKVPAIDAQQAAKVVCEMHSAPMVVYRGRCKRGTRDSYTTKNTTRQATKAQVTIADLGSVDSTKIRDAFEPRQITKDSGLSETEDDPPELSAKDEAKDMDRQVCPPKKRVRFSDQGDESNIL